MISEFSTFFIDDKVLAKITIKFYNIYVNYYAYLWDTTRLSCRKYIANTSVIKYESTSFSYFLCKFSFKKYR